MQVQALRDEHRVALMRERARAAQQATGGRAAREPASDGSVGGSDGPAGGTAAEGIAAEAHASVGDIAPHCSAE